MPLPRLLPRQRIGIGIPLPGRPILVAHQSTLASTPYHPGLLCPCSHRRPNPRMDSSFQGARPRAYMHDITGSDRPLRAVNGPDDQPAVPVDGHRLAQ